MPAPANIFEISLDPRDVHFTPTKQYSNTGQFINFSLQGDQFGVSISGSLAAIPAFAQAKAIVEAIMAIFGLGSDSPLPPIQLKTITVDPGITLATLFGASQGISYLVQLLKGKIDQVKSQIETAITSITNLIKCALKNPLVAASLLARIIRQGWISIPPALREAVQKIRDVLNATIGLNLIVYNPFVEIIEFIKKALNYKFPPPFFLPFIPYVPGCGGNFYSGRPSLVTNTATFVTPQVVTLPGAFTSQVRVTAVTVPSDIGPGKAPNLTIDQLTIDKLNEQYSPFNLYTSGTIGKGLNENLDVTNYPARPNAVNSATRQVQDQLINASQKVTNDITQLNKDISRAGYVPRSNPLDELVCCRPPAVVTNNNC